MEGKFLAFCFFGDKWKLIYGRGSDLYYEGNYLLPPTLRIAFQLSGNNISRQRDAYIRTNRRDFRGLLFPHKSTRDNTLALAPTTAFPTFGTWIVALKVFVPNDTNTFKTTKDFCLVNGRNPPEFHPDTRRHGQSYSMLMSSGRANETKGTGQRQHQTHQYL